MRQPAFHHDSTKRTFHLATLSRNRATRVTDSLFHGSLVTLPQNHDSRISVLLAGHCAGRPRVRAHRARRESQTAHPDWAGPGKFCPEPLVLVAFAVPVHGPIPANTTARFGTEAAVLHGSRGDRASKLDFSAPLAFPALKANMPTDSSADPCN
jgi:hypothetical protein